MGFNEAIGSCLGKFFRLKGRATRAEYWWFVLFIGLLRVCAKLVSAVARITNHSTMGYIQTLDGQVELHELADPKSIIPEVLMVGGGDLLLLLVALLMNLAVIVMVMPLVAVHVRRLHDTGRTGWWVLASNVAVIFGLGMVIGATRAPQPVVAIFMVVVGLGMFVVPLAVFLFTLQPGDSNYNKFDYG